MCSLCVVFYVLFVRSFEAHNSFTSSRLRGRVTMAVPMPAFVPTAMAAAVTVARLAVLTLEGGGGGEGGREGARVKIEWEKPMTQKIVVLQQEQYCTSPRILLLRGGGEGQGQHKGMGQNRTGEARREQLKQQQQQQYYASKYEVNDDDDDDTCDVYTYLPAVSTRHHIT